MLVAAALAQASRVFAPLAAALFIIAIVWPVQKRLQSWMPKLAALAITIVATVAVCLGFASLAAWGFGRVGRSLVGDLPRYQALYSAAVTWLDGHGISVAGLWAEHFNVGWLLRATQQVTTRVNTTLSFWVIVLVYVMLGLLEVENIRRRIERLDNPSAARVLLEGSAATAAKFRKVPGGADADERGDRPAGRRLRVGGRLAVRIRVGRDCLRAQLYPVHRSFHRNAVSDLAGDDAVRELAGGARRLRLPERHPVRGRQLHRAAGGRLHACRFRLSLVLFSIFFWTFLWGLFGTFIGVPDHARDSDLLRRASVEPLGRRSVRRTGS